jgi:hypothetical protein
VIVMVPAPVAQVDPAHVGHIPFGAAAVTQHNELLVVGPAGAHPHVQQALAAGGDDRLPQVAVFLQAEPEPVQVRAPQQAAHDDPPAGRLGQHPRHLRARAIEPLVGIAAPVGE